jgi:hypothetical protein
MMLIRRLFSGLVAASLVLGCDSNTATLPSHEVAAADSVESPYAPDLIGDSEAVWALFEHALDSAEREDGAALGAALKPLLWTPEAWQDVILEANARATARELQASGSFLQTAIRSYSKAVSTGYYGNVLNPDLELDRLFSALPALHPDLGGALLEVFADTGATKADYLPYVQVVGLHPECASSVRHSYAALAEAGSTEALALLIDTLPVLLSGAVETPGDRFALRVALGSGADVALRGCIDQLIDTEQALDKRSRIASVFADIVDPELAVMTLFDLVESTQNPSLFDLAAFRTLGQRGGTPFIQSRLSRTSDATFVLNVIDEVLPVNTEVAQALLGIDWLDHPDQLRRATRLARRALPDLSKLQYQERMLSSAQRVSPLVNSLRKEVRAASEHLLDGLAGSEYESAARVLHTQFLESNTGMAADGAEQGQGEVALGRQP